jgi:DNA-binding winged helix-turn-helix (wHTH) protein
MSDRRLGAVGVRVAPDPPSQALTAHESLDGAPGHGHALPIELAPDLAAPPVTPAPTTTSPSPSAWVSSWPGCERWCAGVAEAPVVATPDFTVDLAAKRVTKGDEELHLTPTEWHFVEVLVRHPGKLVSQRQLLQEVWGPEYRDETNYLRVFMANLRRKLEPDPARPRYFITEAGMGYRFVPSPSA